MSLAIVAIKIQLLRSRGTRLIFPFWCLGQVAAGLPAADKEICDSIYKTWLFKPNLTGTFELPLAINAIRTVTYKRVMH